MADINFFIDGVPVSAKPGETILQVANRYGIYIPAICYSDRFSSPIGACRICIVVIEQLPEEDLRTHLEAHHPVATGKCSRPMPSCVMKPKEGTYVWTNTDALKQARAEIVKKWDRYHPLQCGVCDASGECELQDANLEFNITSGLEQDFDNLPQKTIHKEWPIVNNDPHLCIQCKRCVKICDDVMGVKALAMVKKEWGGFEIDTPDGAPLDCEFCNQCIDICPTGSLESKLFMYKAKSWEMEHIASNCFFCPAGCELELNVKDNKILRVTSHLPSFNDGNLCNLGAFAYDMNENNRISSASIDGKEANTDAVIWELYESLKKITDKYGADSVAIACDSVISSEAMVSAKRLADLIGTKNMLFPEAEGIIKLDMALEKAGLLRQPSYDQIKNSETIFAIGTDLTNSIPLLDWFIIRKSKSKTKKGKLILAHYRESKLDKLKPVKLRYNPGSERELLLLLIQKLAGQKTLEFVKNLPEPDTLIKITGVDAESLDAAAGQIKSGKLSVMVDTVLLEKSGIAELLADLAIASGNQADAIGFWAISRKSNIKGAERFILNNSNYYLDKPDFMQQLSEGNLHAIIHFGNSIERILPAPIISKIADIDLFVKFATHEIGKTEAKKNMVIPVATAYEEDSHYINLEGKLVKAKKAIEAKKDILPVQSIVKLIAEKFNTIMSPIKIKNDFTFKDSAQLNYLEYEYKPIEEIEPKQYPYRLIVGHSRFRSDVSTSFGSGPKIARAAGYAEISSGLAKALDLKSDDKIKIVSKSGQCEASLLISDDLPDNLVVVPEGFSDINPMSLFSSDDWCEHVNIEKAGGNQ